MNKKKNMKHSAAMPENAKISGKEPRANFRYKDAVFRMLFRDRKRLLGLYNAVSGRHYKDPDKLKIITLESAVYMGMKNDLAFLIDMNLYLFEHQSTLNANMPLRFLQYVSAEYERLIASKDLHRKKLVQIPAPHFLVFYNGTETAVERQELKLSDAFYAAEEKPELELRVQILNINKGFNEDLKEQCRTLGEYMLYVDKVRNYTEEMPIDKAVGQAVDECIRQDILKEFLQQNRAEVKRMSIFEYNEEDVRQAIKEDAYEEGFASGEKAGWESGEINGLKEGIKKGLKEGLNKGIKEGRIKDIFLFLEEKGSVPDSLREEISSETDEETLIKWLKSAAQARTVEEFMEIRKKNI